MIIRRFHWLIGGTSFAWSGRKSVRQLDERFNDATVGPTGWMNLTCLIRPTGRADRSDGRSHDPTVGPTGRTDRSGRPVGPTVGSCKRRITFPVENVTNCRLYTMRAVCLYETNIRERSKMSLLFI